MMGLSSGIKAIKAAEVIKNGGTAEMSLAMLTNLLINLPDAKNNLPGDKFQKIYALYKEFQGCNTMIRMDQTSYLQFCMDIISKFDVIAPYQFYSGGNELEFSMMMDDIRKARQERVDWLRSNGQNTEDNREINEHSESYVDSSDNNIEFSNSTLHNDTIKEHRISLISIISLVVSIVGTVLYSLVFSYGGLISLWKLVSIFSVIFPVIAKIIRMKKGQSGKVFEILAIIIGGFNFYCVIFAGTDINLFVGYLGWVICGIVYFMIKPSVVVNKPDDCTATKYQPERPIIVASDDRREMEKIKNDGVGYLGDYAAVEQKVLNQSQSEDNADKLRCGGKIKTSYAMVLKTIVNMQQTEKILTPEKFTQFRAAYNDLLSYTSSFEVDLNGYKKMCQEVIQSLDGIEPFESYFQGGDIESDALKEYREKKNRNAILPETKQEDDIKYVESIEQPQNRTSSGKENVTDQLELIERLSELHKKGILTDEEFSKKKADILGRL